MAAVKADRAKTLDMIKKGEGEFMDRDLYVFCARSSDAKTLPLATLAAQVYFLALGTRTLKESTGKDLARNSATRRRSRKVKSPKSAICLRGRSGQKPATESKLRDQRSAIWAAASAITSESFQNHDFWGAVLQRLCLASPTPNLAHPRRGAAHRCQHRQAAAELLRQR